MVKSAAIGCLLSVLIVSTTTAQCPNRNRISRQSANPRCQSAARSTYIPHVTQIQSGPRCTNQVVVQTNPIIHSQPYTSGYSVVQGYPATQSHSMVQSLPSDSTGFGPMVVQNSFAPTHAYPQSPQIVQGNCNCNGNVILHSSSPAGVPQTASILEHKRNPFSLAGHAHEARPPEYCMQEFLACCDTGGRDCMLNYYKCSEVTGEQLRYTHCPASNKAKAQPQ